jgi:hypothetical protein
MTPSSTPENPTTHCDCERQNSTRSTRIPLSTRYWCRRAPIHSAAYRFVARLPTRLLREACPKPEDSFDRRFTRCFAIQTTWAKPQSERRSVLNVLHRCVSSSGARPCQSTPRAVRSRRSKNTSLAGMRSPASPLVRRRLGRGAEPGNVRKQQKERTTWSSSTLSTRASAGDPGAHGRQ